VTTVLTKLEHQAAVEIEPNNMCHGCPRKSAIRLGQIGRQAIDRAAREGAVHHGSEHATSVHDRDVIRKEIASPPSVQTTKCISRLLQDQLRAATSRPPNVSPR
jgi:hypothetical protein